MAFYFHIRVTIGGERADEVKLDLAEQELEDKFLRPYRDGTSITMNGRTIRVEDISRIRISRSEVGSSNLKAQVEERQRRSSVIVAGGPSREWRAAALAADVTDEYITAPAGSNAAVPSTEGGDSIPTGKSNTVFVVFGRNEDAKDALYAFLTSVGLRPLEWNQAVTLTGEGTPYPGKVLDAAFGAAQAVIVLLTPDEFVLLHPDYAKTESERTTALQARPNVIFEAGMALAKSESRTIVIEFGAHRTFSDIDGRHLIRLEETPQKRNDLLQRLKTAGCEFDASGNQWLSAGDFTPPVVAGSPRLVFDDEEGDVTSGTGLVAGGRASVRDPRAGASANQEGIEVTLQDAEPAGAGTFRVRGRVKNVAPNKRSASFIATFFDEDDVIIGTAMGAVQGVGPGQTKTIELLSLDPLEFYSHMEVQIDNVIYG